MRNHLSSALGIFTNTRFSQRPCSKATGWGSTFSLRLRDLFGLWHLFWAFGKISFRLRVLCGGTSCICRPEFKFTSQYLVKVDDFFLHYLQKVTLLFSFLFGKKIMIFTAWRNLLWAGWRSDGTIFTFRMARPWSCTNPLEQTSEQLQLASWKWGKSLNGLRVDYMELCN